MLQDSLITMRNGRYCLPVRAEYKPFQGMIHDQSSSGSTLYRTHVVVRLNNELSELALKEKQEIEKILADLSEMVAGYVDQLTYNYNYNRA